MNKGLKISLIVISIIIVFALIGGYVALKIFEEAFGTDCEESNRWTVESYEIQEYRCLGWAGPYYYSLYLYEHGKEIAGNGHKLDSCTIRFIPRKDLYLKFNTCSKQVTKLTPDKKLLDLNKIDSIVMVNIELKQTKTLTLENIQKFVRKWNKAPVFDFRDNDNSFYPNSAYNFKVYHNGHERSFETGSFMIKDNDNWSYTFLEKGEETSNQKFDEIWNEIKATTKAVYIK